MTIQRLLHIDIDSLRPDHLGCYGYLRHTSPTIDALAHEGVRFERCYASDAPCLPSRTALWSGKHGFRTGVVTHGGTAAQPFVQGPSRGFTDSFREDAWLTQLQRLGMRTATISSFGDRHSAWHWYAGYRDIRNPGKGGEETADEVTALAIRWLAAHAQQESWYLHVNFWDPHTPYRTPQEYGDPFANDPPPAWPTEAVRLRGWQSYGPHSPQEPSDFSPRVQVLPRQPEVLDSEVAMRRWIDGYDTGIRYADDHIGMLLGALETAGVLDDTAIMVSADHGEAQGELNVWGDHHMADDITCRVPLIVRWPGLPGGRVDAALHYQFDWAATTIELLGGTVPESWDGQTFAGSFSIGRDEGRHALILSQGAWTCQRGVRWDHYLCLRTYHDGYHDLEPVMLFDLDADPHEEHDMASVRPDLVDHAMGLLAGWQHELMLRSRHDVDPLMTVLREGGPFHTRGELPGYIERLRTTGRQAAAEKLLERHSDHSHIQSRSTEQVRT